MLSILHAEVSAVTNDRNRLKSALAVGANRMTSTFHVNRPHVEKQKRWNSTFTLKFSPEYQLHMQKLWVTCCQTALNLVFTPGGDWRDMGLQEKCGQIDQMQRQLDSAQEDLSTRLKDEERKFHAERGRMKQDFQEENGELQGILAATQAELGSVREAYKICRKNMEDLGAQYLRWSPISPLELQ